MSTKIRVFFAAFVTALIVGLTIPSQASDAANPELVKKLNSQFITTKITADRSDIVTPGSVVVLHQNGLILYATQSPMPPSNASKNGKITQGWGGFGKDLAISMAAPGGATASSYPKRNFVAGEKLWIIGITVGKDNVVMELYSDPYGDYRYYGNLKIPFPKGASVTDVLNAVAEVATLDNPATTAPESNTGTDQNNPNAAVAGEYLLEMTGTHYFFLPDGSCSIRNPGGTQSQCQFIVEGDWIRLTGKIGSINFPIGSFKMQGGKLYMNGTIYPNAELVRQGVPPTPAPAPAPEQVPAAVAPIEPPPPPPDAVPAAPKSISLGETKEQVAAIFGTPQKVAKLGAKEIHYYPDMKVVFVNGKVTDIQ